MAMTASGMASKIIGDVSGITSPDSAISTFYNSLCSYCEDNMQVLYTWTATTPPTASTPDPQVLLDCKVKTTGNISPSGATTPEEALSKFASDLNSQISQWQVIWPTGFSIPPALIIPSITFTASKATSQKDAWNHICQEIITGITKSATPGPLAGTHGGFTVPCPGAIFSKIL